MTDHERLYNLCKVVLVSGVVMFVSLWGIWNLIDHRLDRIEKMLKDLTKSERK